MKRRNHTSSHNLTTLADDLQSQRTALARYQTIQEQLSEELFQAHRGSASNILFDLLLTLFLGSILYFFYSRSFANSETQQFSGNDLAFTGGSFVAYTGSVIKTIRDLTLYCTKDATITRAKKRIYHTWGRTSDHNPHDPFGIEAKIIEAQKKLNNSSNAAYQMIYANKKPVTLKALATDHPEQLRILLTTALPLRAQHEIKLYQDSCNKLYSKEDICTFIYSGFAIMSGLNCGYNGFELHCVAPLGVSCFMLMLHAFTNLGTSKHKSRVKNTLKNMQIDFHGKMAEVLSLTNQLLVSMGYKEITIDPAQYARLSEPGFVEALLQPSTTSTLQLTQ